MLSKVLFIDDDSVALMINRKLAEKISFANETITALNGKIALDYYSTLLLDTGKNSSPELVFLDLNMPVVDGWDFLKKFSNTFFIVFCSDKDHYPFLIHKSRRFRKIKELPICC
ncbi:MAG: response regulator [Pyrinomonadaceae bacterium]|nr:response regulator [Sphingobacteriaceae bacterium]